MVSKKYQVSSNTSNGHANGHTNGHANGSAHKSSPHSNYNVEMSPRKSLVNINDYLDILNTPQSDVEPATSYFTTDARGRVKLRTDVESGTPLEPLTIHSLMAKTVKQKPHRVALMYKSKMEDPQYTGFTYLDYYHNAISAAKSFIKLGLDPYKSVAILGFNSPEWFFAKLGAVFAGGFAAGIYTTNAADVCQFIMDDSQSQFVVVENASQMAKILEVRHNLPLLKAIIQYRGPLSEAAKQDSSIYTWESFMELGLSVSNQEVINRLRPQVPNQCLTLIYTSGTTGNPKGVMLSHDNLTFTSRIMSTYAKLSFGEEVIVSYLPLSHVAAQLADIYLAITVGATVYFAQPDALKGSLGATLKEARPTIFLGVPRVWEKMHEKMLEIGATVTGMKRSIADWAKDVSFKTNTAKMLNPRASEPWGWFLANSLVLTKVKQAIGLDRAKICSTAAAPITKETLDYFMKVNVPLMEIYGMSESSGPHTMGIPDAFLHPTVGRTPTGIVTKLDKPDADGNGEICMYGRHIFMGYLNAQEKTDEATDADGYLHSGDIGRLENGYLSITGRIKEIIITAGGENIPPVQIEAKVIENLPVVANAFLIGDKKKFLAMLLSLKTIPNSDTQEPTDVMTPVVQKWLKEQCGCSITSYKQLIQEKPDSVMKAIQAGIDTANKQASSRAQVIQKWTFLTREFSVFNGELGPTLKTKRPVVATMYADLIDQLYRD